MGEIAVEELCAELIRFDTTNLGDGKSLLGELAGLHSARVGAYRVVYQIDETDRVVRVMYVDHRADIYRPR